MARLLCLPPVASLKAWATAESFSSPARRLADRAALERAAHEVVEAVAVALLERRALGLPVVGEHDDLVGARRVLPGAGDAPELLVELAQHLERVGALEARVVRHLVVAREARVDRRPALHHVAEQAVDGDVAHRHGERGAQERVLAAAMAARPDIAADAAHGRDPLQADLVEEQHERARDVEAVGEEGPVPGVGLLLGRHAADGEDDVVGLAREQVAAAGAAVDEEPAAGGVPPLDLLAVGRRRAGHQRARLLLDPAERGDVVVGAQQEARLGGAGLRREVGLPLRQAMRALGQPARHLGGVAVAHRALEHRQRQAVDLQVEDAGHVGHRALAGHGGRCAGSRAACRCRRRWCRAGPRGSTVTAATTRAAASADPERIHLERADRRGPTPA